MNVGRARSALLRWLGSLATMLTAASAMCGACPKAPGPPEVQSGPRRIRFNLSGGTVTLYLPNQILPGDLVSGSAFSLPAGATWDAQHGNVTALDAMYVKIGSFRMRVKDVIFTVSIPKTASDLPVDIESPQGEVFAREDIGLPSRLDALKKTALSAVVQAGAPVGVVGRFDGDRSRTSATVNGHTVGILAEGMAECYVTSPDDFRGLAQLAVEEGPESVSQKVSLVGITFMAPPKPTAEGEKSSIAVEVDGLQDADPSIFPITVELNANRADIVLFDGPTPSRYELKIMQDDVSAGHVLKTVPIRAKTVGSYTVTGRIFAFGE